ncbi:MAG: hypothetical protein V3U49_00415 [Nitrososphaerales archaeon]
MEEPISLPPAAEWIVTQWHYNKDGGEVSNERFNITFRDLNGILYRFYTKQIGRRELNRLERIESPNKPLGELAMNVLGSRPTVVNAIDL